MNEDVGEDWVGLIKGELYSIHVPQDIKDNPKSFFNSKEGIRIRKESRELLEIN